MALSTVGNMTVTTERYYSEHESSDLDLDLLREWLYLSIKKRKQWMKTVMLNGIELGAQVRYKPLALKQQSANTRSIANCKLDLGPTK